MKKVDIEEGGKKYISENNSKENFGGKHEYKRNTKNNKENTKHYIGNSTTTSIQKALPQNYYAEKEEFRTAPQMNE